MEKRERGYSWQMHDDCGSCDMDYMISRHNSRLLLYSKQPEINRLMANCTHCSHPAVFFLTEDSSSKATGGGIPTKIEEGYAPEQIFRGYLKYMLDLDPPEEQEVGHHAELHIQYLGSLLLTEHLTADDFNNTVGELYI